MRLTIALVAVWLVFSTFIDDAVGQSRELFDPRATTLNIAVRTSLLAMCIFICSFRAGVRFRSKPALENRHSVPRSIHNGQPSCVRPNRCVLCVVVVLSFVVDCAVVLSS